MMKIQKWMNQREEEDYENDHQKRRVKKYKLHIEKKIDLETWKQMNKTK